MEPTWHQVRDVVDAALELMPDRRVSYLDAIELEPAVRVYVDSILLNYGRWESEPGLLDDLGETVRKTKMFSDEDDVVSRVGRSIGHYRLIEELGEGGMGVVYRATRVDEQYEQQVAIKIVRTGLDSAFAQEQFRAERQILASLEHPNIARLLDGGTTEDGSPYLVMELIEGQPIDQYCDAQGLNVSERLVLFEAVCSAVQYAHQNLVVHRDLKPGNILVTKDGRPKLLDFGVAKMIDASMVGEARATEATSGFLRMLTLEYASPEQIRGEPIGTTSDIYSLGVILYLLLAGQHPYSLEDRSPQAIFASVCETDPLAPSAAIRRSEITRAKAFVAGLSQGVGGSSTMTIKRVSRLLEGDLDTIVLMALRKEKLRRYGSVEQFSEDLRRYRERLPVRARKNTWGYQTSKFIGRNAGAVSLSILVIASLAAGMLATQRQAHLARTERARAEHRFNDVRKLANSLIFEVHDSIKDLPGATPTRKLLVVRALEYLNSLSSEASGDVSLQRELALAYERVGDVQGNPFYANLGDTPGALDSYKRAVAIRETLYKNDRADRKLQAELAGSFYKLGSCLDALGDFLGALSNLRKSLALVEVLGRDTKDPKLLDRLAGNHFGIAGVLTDTGDLQDALDNFREAMKIRKSAGEAVLAQNPELRTHLAGDLGGMAQVLALQGSLSEAIDAEREASMLLEKLSQADPGNATLQRFMGSSREYMARYEERSGAWDRALEDYGRARTLFLNLWRQDPADALTDRYLAFTEGAIGRVWIRKGAPAKGLILLQSALERFTSLAERVPENNYNRAGFADTYAAMGMAHATLARAPRQRPERRMSEWSVARENYRQSLEIWQDLKKRGVFSAEDSQKPAALAAEIAECDAGLKGTVPRSARGGRSQR